MSLNYKEISFLLNNLKKDISGCLISKITQINKFQIYLILYGKNNKYHLIINIEQNFSYLGYGKPIINAPHNPFNFTSALRKYLEGKKVIDIIIKNNERSFSIKLNNYSLIFELFDRNGNVFLIENSTNKIISTLIKRNSKIRDENPGSIYKEIELKKNNHNFNIRKEIFNFHENPLQSVYIYFNYLKIINYIKSFIKELIKKENKLKKILEKIKNEYKESSEYLKYNNYAKAILTNQNFIKNEIQNFKNQQNKKLKEKKIKIFDYITNNPIEITIDINTDPIVLANRYFHISKKLKRKTHELEKRKNIIENDLIKIRNDIKNLNYLKNNFIEYVNSKTFKKESIENISKYFRDIFNEKLSHFNINNNMIKIKNNSNLANSKKNKQSPFYKFKLSSGKIVIVGKSAKNNLEILKKYANGEDFWFHTRDFPGSYVIVKAKEITQNDIVEASNLAMYFSKAKRNKSADIIFTKCKYLKPIKNNKGKVIYTKNKNFFVELDPEKINTLMQNKII